mmetsp:Transcript_28625/g.40488  ORF Transcript_28625/g.40488 Transcript_28625/m.40488 type:complete len:87 (+) Transcript_28625:269-529(+)
MKGTINQKEERSTRHIHQRIQHHRHSIHFVRHMLLSVEATEYSMFVLSHFQDVRTHTQHIDLSPKVDYLLKCHLFERNPYPTATEL